MKKFMLPFLILTSWIVPCKAQVPNYSFENWTTMGSYENPDKWGTMNNSTAGVGVFTATKGTPGSPGSAFLMLTSQNIPTGTLNGIAVSGVLDTITLLPVSGFEFTARPQSFTGKWQHMIFGNTQGGVYVTLTKWNSGLSKRDTIANAFQELTGMAMQWENFSINFVYQNGHYPDSCIIYLRASGSSAENGDYLWVDSLGFEGLISGIKESIKNQVIVSLYPNPANNELIVETNTDFIESTLYVFNAQGQEILRKRIVENKTSINTSKLTSGVYFVKECRGNDCVTKGKFVKEK